MKSHTFVTSCFYKNSFPLWDFNHKKRGIRLGVIPLFFTAHYALCTMRYALCAMRYALCANSRVLLQRKAAQVGEFFLVVYTGFQFCAAFGECSDGLLHILKGVHGCGNQSEKDISLRYYRVDYH